MAAPLRITDMTSGLLGGEDGRVYIYNGKHTTLGDMTGQCKSWLTPCPEEKVKAVCGVHSMGGPETAGRSPAWSSAGLCCLAVQVLTAVLVASGAGAQLDLVLFTAGHDLSGCPGNRAKSRV